MLHTTENFIKNEQKWPVNIKKAEKEEAEKKKKAEEKDSEESDGKTVQPEQEWRRGRGENQTHNAAYASTDSTSNQTEKDKQENEAATPEKEYSPQEMALLHLLQYEKDYLKSLQEDDGKKISPVMRDEASLAIDEADQFTPDNWIPRSLHLIRLTGKHPLNGEPDVTELFHAGLITPNRLHYVRNHGSVPHLLWETHTIDVENGKLVLSMDDLEDDFDSINIPVALACDGNRRKELNMIRRSKGFNWGPGAISCAYWKGPLLRDILLAAGVKEPDSKHNSTRRWVHFEGSEDLSEGRYSTCIPLDYAMDSKNDVILAYEMNNTRLPPDHGYPVRVIIPGFVGGRCVKWLAKIWVSDSENDSYYHIYDNRVLPSFILDKDSEFAHTMFAHPSTACNEQNLNSVIVAPAHGEKILLKDVRKGAHYRIQGFAYGGGGHEIQRVEVSLDGGENWLYCIRKVSCRVDLPFISIRFVRYCINAM